MSLIPALDISASGLKAQKFKMDLTSANLANAQTTRGPDGLPFRKVNPVFEAVPVQFETDLHNEMGVQLNEVKLTGVQEDPTPFKRFYDPGHPDADQEGFVQMPNVNLIQEMADMLLASRAYEANITSFNTSKSMALKLLDIGKG